MYRTKWVLLVSSSPEACNTSPSARTSSASTSRSRKSSSPASRITGARSSRVSWSSAHTASTTAAIYRRSMQCRFSRAKRRSNVLKSTMRLMTQMDSAGGIANENILLHAKAAQSVISSLNATAAVVGEFHDLLGIESTRRSLNATPWSEALKDPHQRLRAGKEAGRNALIGIATVGAAAVTFGMSSGSKPTK